LGEEGMGKYCCEEWIEEAARDIRTVSGLAMDIGIKIIEDRFNAAHPLEIVEDDEEFFRSLNNGQV
jgi:hypothetical protein